MSERWGDRLDLTPGVRWCAAGAVALAAGTWAPWVRFTYDHTGTISGTDAGDSAVMLVIAVAVVAVTILAMFRVSWRALWWLVAVLGVVAFAVAVVDIVDVTPRVTTRDAVDARIARGDSPLHIHPGWGLYLCAGGAIAVVIGAVMLGTRWSPREAPRVRRVGAVG